MENIISKNDKIWNELFEKYSILEAVENNGFFEITAEQIKEAGREPRLMTKFDSKENLPGIFSKNNLAILPIKRGSYIIGKFENYQEVEIDNNIDVTTKMLPDYITTIKYDNITSEAISLSSAFISGMIKDIIGEDVVPTIQGRMGTGEFSYKINIDNGQTFDVEVQNSQMEIDGSYEGISKFVIVEAKNHYMSDFIVRQLYYPYRVWKNNTTKEIIPIMLIKHDNIYNFYIYDFIEENNYNSIKLKNIKRYILGEVYQSIEYDDIVEVMNNVSFVEENNIDPFPQANSFHRVLDLINELNEQELSAIEISELYEFDIRQANYYLAAAKYLDLVEKNGTYHLTELGKQIMKMNHKQKNLSLIKQVISHKPFYFALEQYIKEHEFNCEKISNIIKKYCPNVNEDSTAKRRTSTVTAWINWIVEISSGIEKNKF